MPTNGSMDDVLIRLDPALQQDARGHWDQRIYELNLAVVEALIRRADVAIDPVDEARSAWISISTGASASRRTSRFGRPQPRPSRPCTIVGRARDARRTTERSSWYPGLFPLNTEFLHSVRYLDVDASGAVVMAPRMKELRYTKKVRWLSPADLAAHAAAEATEQTESPDGAVEFIWQFDRGIYNGQGWLLQGFIEAANGMLRPQSYEESLFCVGCHGEIGATTDSIFAFARKLDDEAPRAAGSTSRNATRAARPARAAAARRPLRVQLLSDQQRRRRRFAREHRGAGALLRRRRRAARATRSSSCTTTSARCCCPAPRARWISIARTARSCARKASPTGATPCWPASRHVQERVKIGEKTGVEKRCWARARRKSAKPVLGRRLGG